MLDALVFFEATFTLAAVGLIVWAVSKKMFT